MGTHTKTLAIRKRWQYAAADSYFPLPLLRLPVDSYLPLSLSLIERERESWSRSRIFERQLNTNICLSLSLEEREREPLLIYTLAQKSERESLYLLIPSWRAKKRELTLMTLSHSPVLRKRENKCLSSLLRNPSDLPKDPLCVRAWIPAFWVRKDERRLSKIGISEGMKIWTSFLSNITPLMKMKAIWNEIKDCNDDQQIDNVTTTITRSLELHNSWKMKDNRTVYDGHMIWLHNSGDDSTRSATQTISS